MRTDKQQTSSFPYLAVETKDYKDTTFTLNVDKGVKDNKVCFNVAYFINNSTINDLILKNKIIVAVKMDCGTLGFTKTNIISPDSKGTTFIIDKNNIDDHIDFIAYLIANENLNYKNESFSKDWDEKTYYIEKGNKIGESVATRFNLAHKEIGRKESIFHFSEKLDMQPLDPVIYKLGDESINFIMSRETFRLYFAVQTINHEAILTSFIVPALTDILRLMTTKTENDDFNSSYEEKNWYRVIVNKCKKILNIDPTTDVFDPYSAAQKLVSSPVYNLLRTIKFTASAREEN